MTIGDALKQGIALLSDHHIETPYLDAALLLGDLLHINRSALIARDRDEIPQETVDRYIQTITRRCQGEPVAYLLGRKDFWNLSILVTPAVLIPRPDTEILVEAALEFLTGLSVDRPLILDLCTGSGAIALAVKHDHPQCDLYALDISPQAISIAQKNCSLLFPGDIDAITFFVSDLFSAIETASPGKIPQQYHLILANPPYIPEALIETLSPSVQREPRIALNGGSDGLALIRRIVQEAHPFLYPGGALFLEAQSDQMEIIEGLLTSQGYVELQRNRDLSNQDRVISGKKNKDISFLSHS